MSLTASLLVSLMFVPVFTTKMLGAQKERKDRFTVWSEFPFPGLEKGYGALASPALRHRAAVVVLTAAIFSFGILLKRVGMDCMPQMDGAASKFAPSCPPVPVCKMHHRDDLRIRAFYGAVIRCTRAFLLIKSQRCSKSLFL